MVVDTFEFMHGGELLVPRIPSIRVTDLAHAVVPGAELVDVGLRPGEKLHEEMISPEEGRRTVILDGGDYYVIQPDLATWGYKPPAGSTPAPEGFSYQSDSNDQWLSVDEIQALVANID